MPQYVYTARYGKTVRAYVERARSNAHAQAKKQALLWPAHRAARSRWTKANHMCQIRGPFIKFNNALKPKEKLKFGLKSMQIWTQLSRKRFTKPLLNLSRNLPMFYKSICSRFTQGRRQIFPQRPCLRLGLSCLLLPLAFFISFFNVHFIIRKQELILVFFSFSLFLYFYPRIPTFPKT